MRSNTGDGAPTDPVELQERLAAVQAELQQLAHAQFAGLGGADAARVAQQVEVTTRACEALTNAAVAGLQAGEAWAQSGARSFARWWTTHTHRKSSTARSQVKTARTLGENLPGTAEAFTGGRISGEHVQVLSRKATKTRALREQLTDPEMGEDFLVEQATRLPVEAFSKVVAAWAVRTDPEAADRDWREQGAAEEVFLSPTLDGYALNGWLNTEHGQALDEALQAVIGVPAATDERHPAQRRADAFTHLARASLDSGQLQPGARIRPHIAVTVEEPALAALIAAGRPPDAVDLDPAQAPPRIGAPEAAAVMAEASGAGDAVGAEDRRRAGSANEAEVAPEMETVNGAEFAGRPEDTGGVKAAGADGELVRTTPDRTTPDTGRVPGDIGTSGITGSTRITNSTGSSHSARSSYSTGDTGITIPGDLDYAVLRGTAPAEWADGTPIAPAHATKMLCDGEFHRIVFGPEGQILDSGRTCRLFTPAQTRAVIARDKYCQFPDCTAPPGQGEIHHSIWWYHQGRTSTDNAILLCWYHHDYVHQQRLSITSTPHGWSFTTPEGRTLEPTPPP